MKSTSIGLCLTVVATFLLSFRSILVKFAYAEGVSVPDLLFYRYLFALPLFLAFAVYVKRGSVIETLKRPSVFFFCLGAGFFGYYFATLMDLLSLERIDASINRVVVYSYPIYVLLLQSFVKKSWPSLRDAFYFVAVQISLFFVLGGTSLNFEGIDMWGVAFALFAALSYSVYILINQHIGKEIGSILITTYAVFFSFFFVTLHYSLVSKGLGVAAISVMGYVIIIAIALFCTFLPLLFISEGIARIGATRFALVNASGPVMTLLFAALFLAERLSVGQWVAACLLVLLLLLSERR